MSDKLLLIARDLPTAVLPAEAPDTRSRWAVLLDRRVALSVAGLAAAGASVALAIATIFLPVTTSYFTTNLTPRWVPVGLSAALGAGALVGALGGLVPLIRRGPRAIAGLDRAARLLSPLILAALLPSLFAGDIWHDRPLPYLLTLALLGLGAERLFTLSFAAAPPAILAALGARIPPRVRAWIPVSIVTAAALAYGVYFSYYTILHHRLFGTAAFDMGINVNRAWNGLHGHFWRVPVMYGPGGGSMLPGHAIFAMALWLPFFAIAPGTEVLLIYQAMMVGLAAIPLYAFAKTQVSRATAVVVAIAYLLFAPVHGPNFYDFHELPVALPFFFLLFWSIAAKRHRWTPVFVVLICAHREDMAVGLTLLGLFLWLSGARPRLGPALALVCGVWFVIIKFVIMPMAGSWWFADLYKDLQPGGHGGYGAVVRTALINPTYFITTLVKEEKLVYFLHMFAPLVFLPARRLLLFLLAVPGFFFTLMTTGYAPTVSIAFQYTTHWVPYLFASVVITLKLLANEQGAARARAALVALALAVVSHSVIFGAVFSHQWFVGGFSRVRFEGTADDADRLARFRAVAALIPRDASVAATEREVPHVAARMNVYTLRITHADADYLLIRRGDAPRAILEDAFARNRYGLLARDGEFFLFKKDHDAPGTEAAKREVMP